MNRLLAVLALVVGGALAGVIVASSGGDSTSTAATSTAATSTPVVAPAIPCSSSGTQSTTTSTSTPSTTSTSSNTSNTPSNATWTGVFERVTAQLEEDGSVKKTPRQFTRVSAEGNAPTTVLVPMSDKDLRRRDKGKKPKFSNGMAEINLDPSGTKTQQLDSNFAGSLPVAVKVSFEVNGKPISAGDVKGKSGSVQVSYQVSNTTSKPVTVCFNGFNGAKTQQTVTTPIPLIAYVSFTVPDNATAFHAPGAALGPARKGVTASWTVALFKPLGSTSRTFTFTMNTSKAKIPEAHVLLETLNPLSLTGSVPAKSAAAVGHAAAAAHSAAAKVQSDIAALQVKAGQPKQPRSSSRGGGRSKSTKPNATRSTKPGSTRSTKPKSTRSTKSKSTTTRPLSFGTPTSALTTMQQQIFALGNANRTFIGDVNRPTRKLFGSTRRSVHRLAARTRSTIGHSTTKVDRTINLLNARIDRSLGGLAANMGKAITLLKADLRRSIDSSSLAAIAANSARVQSAVTGITGQTDATSAAVADLATQVNDLVAGLPAPVQNALALVQGLGQVSDDLDSLNGADKTDPTFLKLAADVAAARALADTVSRGLTDLQQRAQAIASNVQTLQADVASLQTGVSALEAAAAANAAGTIHGQLTAAVAGLNARFAKAQASAARATANAETKAVDAVGTHAKNAKRSAASAANKAKRSVSTEESDAQHGLTSAVRKAQRTVLSAERSLTDVLTSVQDKANRALVAAKQKAKQGGQASLAAAQAAAAQASAAAGQAVATANADYAALLTTNERAFANQLPGGNAPGVTEQNGSFRYVIKGS